MFTKDECTMNDYMYRVISLCEYCYDAIYNLLIFKIKGETFLFEIQK